MFQPNVNRTTTGSFFTTLQLIYHATVRSLRMSHTSPIIGLLINMMQSFMFIAVFYLMFTYFNLKGSAVRGDFLLYVMSGVLLFMTHIKTVSAVQGAEGPTSPMMQHAPMNILVAICSAALAQLYLQTLTVIVMLTIYYCLVTPFVIIDPFGAYAMLLAAWFSGIGVGMVFLAIKPWFPGFTGVASGLYRRANMLFSGKMVLGNSLPASKLIMFSWNPLFHAIDQGRGFIFINYAPHNSWIYYPFYVGMALIVVGLMGEFYTRQYASISWNAKR